MSTWVLNDINDDLKRLITALTSFEEDEEGFRICERFCLLNIKHHRYLSIDSHAIKEAINAVITKFSIHGKYEVAKKFQELIDSFLTSFDFEQHPQYDLQWYLLTFLLDLSTETHKSNLDSLKFTYGEHSFNTVIGNEESIMEEIDWMKYLREGQEIFFCDYKSDDNESEWSNLTEEEPNENDISLPMQIYNAHQSDIIQSSEIFNNTIDKFSLALVQNLESRKWLLSNVQTDWWNNLRCQKYPVIKQSCDTSIYNIWHEANLSSLYNVTTLSEYQVCRELLWMFHVQTSMVVLQQDSESKFSICSDISIPSLTITAFKSILTPFCEYFSMIYDIEKFGADLQSIYNQDSELQSPPLTYEAYNAALKQHLYEFKIEMVNIEKDLIKQENCNTFLSLSANLRRHLNTIKTLHNIHKNIITDWKVSPNWKCASRLLSSLYYEMQSSYNQERTNICINLYLHSLTVYLNIIDTWLNEGRLEDWRDEFIIMRVTENENEQIERFTIRMSDNICLIDPIMQFLLQKIQHMGHSIELLVSLDRIADIWRIDNEYNDIRISLNIELQNKLLSEISKYNSLVEETDSAPQINEILQKYDADIEKNIIRQLSTLHNPFFMKAMEDYIPCELYKNDIVDACVYNTHNSKMKQSQIYDLYKKLQKIKYILPMQNILENTLSEILTLRYDSASKLVKNIMIEEYKLQTHLKLLRFVYMMEAGHVMNKFYQILFHEIENNQIWANSYFLSCILEEVFSQYWPDTSSRWSITIHGNVKTHQVLQAINSITLHYTVEWPINIVLTKKVLEKYNEIFRFQLKLKWALWTLNNLRFCDIENSRSCIRNRLEQFHVRRLESLRFWLLHAIGSIHTYLSGQVLQSLGFILEEVLAQADNLDTIVSVHNEYLSKVYEHCLLTEEFQDLMTTINNMIEMCIHIRDRWSYKKLLLTIPELDIMEHSYIKYHTYLALALHNAVQHKDADYLTALSSAFNCSIPCA